MPTDNGLRLDEDQYVAPTIPKMTERNPEQPVARFEMWPRTAALEHHELLSQSQDLQTEVVAGVKE